MNQVDKLLAEYDIGSNGFLPDTPVDKLTFGSFIHWESLVDQLPLINKNKKIREEIAKMDEFRWQDLSEPWHFQRACTILSMLAHSFVFGQEPIVYELPSIIAVPFWRISEKIGINPVLTHATVDLFNWNKINPMLPIELDNLRSTSLMTGTSDEEWFYLIMVAIEQVGGDIMRNILNINFCVKENNFKVAKQHFQLLYSDLDKINDIIKRMYEKCNPDVFYNTLRPFLSGWKGNKNLPDGMIYEGISDQPFQFYGGSAAESSLFQVIDYAFGIEHKEDYFKEIRAYMPEKHRNFITYVQKNINLRDLITESDNAELVELLNSSISKLKTFRTHHFGLVHNYIIKNIQKVTSVSDDDKDTGGTPLKSFLMEVISETR